MIRNTKILKNAAFLVIKTESSGGSTSTILNWKQLIVCFHYDQWSIKSKQTKS